MNKYLNEEIEKLLNDNKKKSEDLVLNNNDIARKLKITGAFLSALKSSKKKISPKTAVKMQRVFGWDKKKLCPDIDWD